MSERLTVSDVTSAGRENRRQFCLQNTGGRHQPPLLSSPPLFLLNNRNRRKQNETNYKKTHEAVDAFPSFYETVSHTVGYFRMFCPISFDLSPKIQGDALFWARLAAAFNCSFPWSYASTAVKFIFTSHHRTKIHILNRALDTPI